MVRGTFFMVGIAALPCGHDAPIIKIGDGLEQIEQSQTLTEGLYLTAAYSPEVPTEATRRFVEAFTRRYPGGASPNRSPVGTCDARRLLAGISEQTGTGRAQIRNVLTRMGRQTPAFAGLTRSIAFDSAGDLTDQVFVGRVHNGRVLPAESQ